MLCALKDQYNILLPFNALTYTVVLFVLRGVINSHVSGNLYSLHMLLQQIVRTGERTEGLAVQSCRALKKRVRLRSGLGFTTSLNLAEGGTCSFTLDYTIVITQIARKLNN